MAPLRQSQDACVCVEGGSAHWLEPDSPELPGKASSHRRIRRKTTIFIDPLAALGTLVALGLMVCMVVGMFQVEQVNRQIQQVQTELSTLKSRQAILQAEYTRGYDLQEIYQAALDLGMVPMGEAEHRPVHIPARESSQERPWWEQWWMDFQDLFAYP